MTQLILTGLYESLALTIIDMARLENPDSLSIGGDIWLMQLWLNATFESSLKHTVIPNSRVEIEGPHLSKLTPDERKDASIKIFGGYLRMSYRCENVTETVAPFCQSSMQSLLVHETLPHSISTRARWNREISICMFQSHDSMDEADHYNRQLSG